ncbi:MAG: hypothetical protein JF612_08130, partial [Planctomycetia bacterium]|nr:hypothetical protein [Planctomycetia bacterium]
YGGSFRHRDANWIYAAELTELVSEFPLSRDSLAHALREIGALELRSEYDRVFLYRCLANRKSAGPERYSAAVVLTMDERRAVATRLERFLEAFIHGKSADSLGRWKTAAEQRLGIKLSIVLKTTAASVRDQIVDAIRSLASFLVAIKQLDPPEAALHLANSAVLRELPIEERAALANDVAAGASFFFEHPDLDPDGDLADKYLEDLASLNARTPPRAAGVEVTLDDVAAYLRRPPRKMQAMVEKHYATALFERLPADTPQRRVPAAAARAALDLLVDSQARFLYGPARLEWPEERRPEAINDQALWLLGVDRRMLLFSASDQPRVLWIGTATDVHVQPMRQLLATGCRLSGGQWQVSLASRPLAIRLSAGLVASYAAYFEPLLSMLGQTSFTTHHSPLT